MIFQSKFGLILAQIRDDGLAKDIKFQSQFGLILA